MAIGPITVGAAANNAKGAPSAPIFHDRLTFIGDDSYVTGGNVGLDALFTAALGRTVTVLDVLSGDIGDHYAVYKPAAGGTLMVFLRSTGAEVANAVDLSSVTFNLSLLSK